MDIVPVVNALLEIVVGVAVKFAYVPPTATTPTAATDASERRIFVFSVRIACPFLRKFVLTGQAWARRGKPPGGAREKFGKDRWG